MAQMINDAVEALEDPEMRKLFEDEQEERQREQAGQKMDDLQLLRRLLMANPLLPVDTTSRDERVARLRKLAESIE